ncbi:MAG: hypothetical protein HC915_04120 [Anaerolineae bacterium]|nr:hypothetical protein [Anaerolineae bacterium]
MRWIISRVGLGLTLGILLSLLVACTGSQQEAATSVPPLNLQFVTTSTNMTLQENRLVVTLWRGGDYYAEVESLQVRAHDPNQPQHPVVWEGPATAYPDYAIPYWVAYPEVSAPGLWRFGLTVKTTHGQTVEGSLLVQVRADDAGVQVGMPAPPSQTLALSTTELPLYQISSDAAPLPALYSQSVAEALVSGRPSLITFATPGLCTNRICTPVLDSTIKPIAERYGELLNVLHVEVYDLQTSQYVPAMAEWGLSYEPWTYLVDGQGRVWARFDGPVSVLELTPALEALLAEG